MAMKGFVSSPANPCSLPVNDLFHPLKNFAIDSAIIAAAGSAGYFCLRKHYYSFCKKVHLLTLSKMTKHQIELVQHSWEKIKPVIQAASESFYSKLFERAPQVRHLFKEDISEQAAKLGFTLTYVVSRLDKLDTILEDVQKLAIRHNNYGAEPAHYALVGECLLATLEEGLGADWNNQLKEAWATVYGILADAMIQAQQESSEQRA
jgi:nitric oxide dioxygenase